MESNQGKRQSVKSKNETRNATDGKKRARINIKPNTNKSEKK